MFPTRIIGVITIYQDIAVQSIGFQKYLPIGKPEIAISFLDSWGIDEIVVLDIKGSSKNKINLFKKLKNYTKNCHTPITAGGGIKSLKDIENLIRNGADKVMINSYSLINKNLIKDGIKEFGSQAIMVGLDIKKIKNNYEVFYFSGQQKSKYSFKDTLKILENSGAGEIFINSIDRDGKKNGYDLNLAKIVKSNIKLPLIFCGGAGSANDFLKILPYNISGIAAGNFFHFTEHSVIFLKKYLNKFHKELIRLDANISCRHNFSDLNFRPTKANDEYLENLKFKKITKNYI